MNKTTSIIVSIALVAIIGIVFIGSQASNDSSKNEVRLAQNVEVRDGVQYITINVRGGYLPRSSVAQANMPTKLIMKTNGTYDCSAALVIKSIGYQKILPNTGEEIIDLGTPQAGAMQGTCSMGMYNFVVNFN